MLPASLQVMHHDGLPLIGCTYSVTVFLPYRHIQQDHSLLPGDLFWAGRFLWHDNLLQVRSKTSRCKLSGANICASLVGWVLVGWGLRLGTAASTNQCGPTAVAGPCPHVIIMTGGEPSPRTFERPLPLPIWWYFQETSRPSLPQNSARACVVASLAGQVNSLSQWQFPSLAWTSRLALQ